MRLIFWVLLLFSLTLSACVHLPSDQKRDSELTEQLYAPALKGIRWGIFVSDLDGKILLEHRADDRFIPASNTKLFTTALAFHFKDSLERFAPHFATRVALETGSADQPPTLILTGFGDPALTDRTDCETRCLSHLADNIVDIGIVEVGDIVGDETWFPGEAWPPGWSWEDLQWGYGTSISALSVNDNLYALYIAPGLSLGEPADVRLLTGFETYHLSSTVTTVETVTEPLRISRPPGDKTLSLNGQVALSTPPRTLHLGIDTPALFAAERLKYALKEAGIKVSGQLRTRTKRAKSSPLTSVTEPALPCSPQLNLPHRLDDTSIARLPPPDWLSMLRDINKLSQNLYAEIMLRHIGRLCGSGTRAEGLAQLDALIAITGAPKTGHSFFDGSGMSVYNRVSPRTIGALLVYAARQDWGADWQQTFPIAGHDGGLEQRFLNTPLAGRLFAKTGTLKGVNALSGYMTARSGRRLAFSIIANDRPVSESSAIPDMDAALINIAARY